MAKNLNTKYLLCLVIYCYVISSYADAKETVFTGHLELSHSQYTGSPALSEQSSKATSVSGHLRYETKLFDRFFFNSEWRGFYSNEDNKLYRVDLPEFNLSTQMGRTNLLIGSSVVSTGSALIQSIADPINTREFVENRIHGEKLGQPMLRVEHTLKDSELIGYILPFHRKQKFSGEEGRIRTNPPIQSDRQVYDTGNGQDDIAVAVRYLKHFGGADIGLTAFHGNSRAAFIDLDTINLQLFPKYPEKKLMALDGQVSLSDWLLAFEVGAEEVLDEVSHPTSLSIERVFPIDQSELRFTLQIDRSGGAIRAMSNKYMPNGTVVTNLKLNDIRNTELELRANYNFDTDSLGYVETVVSSQLQENVTATLAIGFLEDGAFSADLAQFVDSDDYIKLSVKFNF